MAPVRTVLDMRRYRVARDHAGRYNVCAWSSAMLKALTPRLARAWSNRTYAMVAEVIRKVARYEGADHAMAANENERVRLTIAKLFADQFEADSAEFDRSGFLKACNNG